MKKAFQILFISIVCLITATKANYAQNIGSRTEIFTIENGLSQTGINNILRDSKGYLWIGTQDGLNRYDGNNFQIFRHQPNDSNSICDNYIRHICEDRNGFIWIATNNGLSKYDHRLGIFINYYNDPTDNKSIISNSLYYVFADYEGYVWIKTTESVEKFNPRTNTFTHYFHFNNVFNFISGDFYFSIQEDDNNRLWIGTKDGLNCFYKDLELFERYEWNKSKQNTISNNKIKAICKDKTGNLWIGTENGLNYFNKKNKTFQRFFNSPENPNSLINNSVNELFLDSENILWIGTQNGFCSYNQSTNTFKQFSYTVIRGNKFQLSGISSIFKDKTNILWIGSFQGLVKIDMKPPKFNTLRPNTETNFNSNNINAIWYGLGEGGLAVEKANGLKSMYSKQTLPQAFSGSNIQVIYPDNKNRIWFGTNNGITLCDLTNGNFTNLNKLNTDCSFLENNRIFSIFQDSRGLMWIGSEHGLYTLTFQNNKILNSIVVPDSQGFLFGSVFSIVEDSAGLLWFGTNRGLIKFDYSTKESKQYVSSTKINLNSISSNFVYSLLWSSKNTLWIGTSSGLCKYNSKADNFTIYTEKEGLTNNFVNALLEDKTQTLWISTNRGLSSFNTSDQTFNNYDLADGLQGYEFNQGSACKSESGGLFFGGTNGINYFNPQKIQISKIKPNIDISWIELIGKYTYKIPVWHNKVIHIPANTNMFTISFAVLDFTYPENNQYMYLLSRIGKEGNWVNTNSKPTATFSNLPPGNYTFKVKGANSDFIWSDNEYEISIIVESPIWKSNSAIALYIIILLFVIYVAIQWRTRKLRHSNKTLQDKEIAASKIAEQKEELTIKNKNITDSINYAKRIQVAMMPSEKTFKRLLPNSFVYHKPKDIVSGDFYWLYERNSKIFLAAVDCTGHGVPGAFMSILGVELFRKITLTQTEDPGKILSQLNSDFSHIFSDIEDISLKDGMDISFCVIDKANYSLEFAGAFNPLYLVRDNKIIEIKGNRFAVSMEKKAEELNFTTHFMNLQKGDMMYIFSDGYADQFGGYENKKFKYRRLRHLLLNIHNLPLERQKAYLDESMDSWKGKNEQVDDILIIGISADFENTETVISK
jgi:ligand-binding sensor domain-containing protein/serine phosphatase RsbU (regulator of sigma subunit)